MPRPGWDHVVENSISPCSFCWLNGWQQRLAHPHGLSADRCLACSRLQLVGRARWGLGHARWATVKICAGPGPEPWVATAGVSSRLCTRCTLRSCISEQISHTQLGPLLCTAMLRPWCNSGSTVPSHSAHITHWHSVEMWHRLHLHTPTRCNDCASQFCASYNAYHRLRMQAW